MYLKISIFFAGLLFLSACAYQPMERADSTNTGNAESGTTSSNLGAITPGSENDFVANVGDRVFFDYDKASLSAEAQATLSAQAKWLTRYPATVILVEGHCDERGTREYNLALGARRANAVRDFLISQGVDSNRIDTISYGKERPAALGNSDEVYSQNRRSVTVVR